MVATWIEPALLGRSSNVDVIVIVVVSASADNIAAVVATDAAAPADASVAGRFSLTRSKGGRVGVSHHCSADFQHENI